jgi:hypothetical protein
VVSLLEQRITIKCRVKSGNNASDTCEMLSGAYGGEALKNEVFLSPINRSERVTRMWMMMEEVVIQDLTEPMKMLKIAESVAFRPSSELIT